MRQEVEQAKRGETERTSGFEVRLRVKGPRSLRKPAIPCPFSPSEAFIIWVTTVNTAK